MMDVAATISPSSAARPRSPCSLSSPSSGLASGYPLAGLLAELSGVRAAYGLGLFVTAIAFLTAWRTMPKAREGRSAYMDIAGALLLAGGLFLASETSLWSHHIAVAVVFAVVPVLMLCVWTAYSLRTKTPLVDVRAVRHRAVAGANLAMFVGGIGMYLLLTLITRYAQTPHSAGYDFGLTTFVEGLVLVPFSVLGLIAGKLTPRLRERIDPPLLLAGSAVVVGGGFALFAANRSNLAELFVAMGVLGFGAELCWDIGYNASKAALNAVTVPTAHLLAGRAIVVASHPGWIRTDMGGTDATLEPDVAAQQLATTIVQLTAEHNGCFLHADGTTQPW
jgi:NAD(P)-dependent dehydrogenase (short-subunit alcohol dehydrogenase family)